jgi:hypothetical protein
MFSFLRTQLMVRHLDVSLDEPVVNEALRPVSCRSVNVPDAVPGIRDLYWDFVVHSSPGDGLDAPRVESRLLPLMSFVSTKWHRVASEVKGKWSRGRELTIPLPRLRECEAITTAIHCYDGDLSWLPVTRRLLRVGELSDSEWHHWLVRLAHAKRLSTARVRLLGIVPDVPLAVEQPVSWQSERQAIVFQLSCEPAPLSTLVIGFDRITEGLLLGRFYREKSGNT